MKQILTALTLLFFISCTSDTSMKQELDDNWTFRQQGKDTWSKAAVPGTVHTDLMAANEIPDPYYRDNENKVQWVSRENWEYQTIFDCKPGIMDQEHVVLHFDGIDTYADVFLNGTKILSADNMFRTWEADVKSLLKEKGNELYLLFYSPDKMADSLAAASPVAYPSDNNRHYVRKAQYHYGWDWGPKLTTSGIWKPVSLLAWNGERKEEVPVAKYGKKDVVKLVQEPDSIGVSFYFTVNGEPTFMKGANWIPADMFLPRITKDKYRELLVAAKEANINMLRVWGGGIYEDDYFYDLCDSLGIYVWQDFMFACAMYPGDSGFLESIKQEAIDNIKRLRHHSSIVLWCGNNEIDEAWHNWGWQKQFNLTAAQEEKVWNEYQQLFHDLLPSLVKEYDPERPYITTSPQKGWGRKESMTQGDSHYWGLWHGLEPVSVMKEKVPRFMSEYGMQAMPNISTIHKYAIPSDFDTASEVMKVHQKHRTGYANLAKYIAMENLQPKTFEEYVAATQEVQHRALSTAITAHMNSGGRCMGTLFWQFNDCWPVSSWSVVDYYGEKKKAYYTVQELYGKKAETVKPK